MNRKKRVSFDYLLLILSIGIILLELTETISNIAGPLLLVIHVLSTILLLKYGKQHYNSRFMVILGLYMINSNNNIISNNFIYFLVIMTVIEELQKSRWDLFRYRFHKNNLLRSPLIIRYNLTKVQYSFSSILFLSIILGSLITSIITSTIVILCSSHYILSIFYKLKMIPKYKEMIHEILSDKKPDVLIHYSNTKNNHEHLVKLISELEQSSINYIVVLRQNKPFNLITQYTSKPVVVLPGYSDLDEGFVDSLKTILYVNNSNFNNHMARYRGVKHIQVGPLYNELDIDLSFSIYDTITVDNTLSRSSYIDKEPQLKSKFVSIKNSKLINDTKPNNSNKHKLYIFAFTSYESYLKYQHIYKYLKDSNCGDTRLFIKSSAKKLKNTSTYAYNMEIEGEVKQSDTFIFTNSVGLRNDLLLYDLPIFILSDKTITDRVEFDLSYDLNIKSGLSWLETVRKVESDDFKIENRKLYREKFYSSNGIPGLKEYIEKLC